MKKSSITDKRVAEKAESTRRKPASAEPKATPAKGPTREIQGREQTKTFERAVALFRKREFGKALEVFREAIEGPSREVAHAAAMHIRMCERRLQSAELAFRTPDDRYTYGVALMNQGRLAQAEQEFRRALADLHDADHIHYTLALCCGLQGKLEEAARHLRRAVEIQPGNRISARNDPDFQRLVHHALIREILSA